MHIESESSFDVVVVGGGIAGCCAAIEAARAGAAVCLASAAGVFFRLELLSRYVGLRGCPDLATRPISTIWSRRFCASAAACPMRRSSTRSCGIPEAIATLEAMGVSLKRPANPDEPQYIPASTIRCACGAGLSDSMKRGFEQNLAKEELFASTGAKLLDIAMDDGRVRGALFFDYSAKRFRAVSCGRSCLGEGGVVGFYKRSLSASGNSATVQGACRAAARVW